MTMGNIGTWEKKISDAIAAGDVLVETETDKLKWTLSARRRATVPIPWSSQAPRRSTLEDIEKFADFTAAAADADYTDIPVINMSFNSVETNLSSHYVTVEMEMGKVMKLREVLNKSSEDKHKLSIKDFIVKASARPLKAVPRDQQLADER
ncbi:pyruvate dehydrogenase complex dihydrolipoamide acetyltransferase component (E2) [Mortierella hygrophila]|uniref:Pyruvate dehydrogenase complex dihydrolipoamide acetyltransferase component (E2) n=1 Tax=Mortierella hygrophila TaxID=979708 RepID=A0A9P6JZH9_9FUNG|nr:pyruvate dehydrogenase complex dihydrolipoamide acetyltransferase component (E2) [Mortierella hygrophila]